MQDGERSCPGDAVDRDLSRTLKVTECARGPSVEVPADRHELTAPRKQELQNGDIPADEATMHRPLSEERSSEGAEGTSRRAPGSAVDVEAGAPLEARDAPASRRA
jgi:hypothetical protein